MTSKYVIKDGLLKFSSINVPVPVFHGTTKFFKDFDSQFHKSEINDNYQGDWFCNSESESVGYEYTKAARNRNIGKDIFFKELLEKVCPKLDNSKYNASEIVFEICKTAIEKGCDEGWQVLEREVEKSGDAEMWSKFDNAVSATLDIDELLRVTELVEGSMSGDFEPDGFESTLDILNARVSGISPSTLVNMKSMGFERSIPYQRVVCSYLKVDNFLETNSREEALEARGSYDLVIYSGEDCVNNEPEFLVASSSSLFVKYHKWYEPEEVVGEYGSEGYVLTPKILTRKALDNIFGNQPSSREREM